MGRGRWCRCGGTEHKRIKKGERTGHGQQYGDWGRGLEVEEHIKGINGDGKIKIKLNLKKEFSKLHANTKETKIKPLPAPKQKTLML